MEKGIQISRKQIANGAPKSKHIYFYINYERIKHSKHISQSDWIKNIRLNYMLLIRYTL